MSTPRNRSIKQQIISNFINDRYSSEIERIRIVRNWVNTNSIHLIDVEHDRYAFKIDQVLEKLLLYNNTTKTKLITDSPPHLSCGPRTYAMKEILKSLKFRSRVVDIFEIQKSKVNPHTLLEVYSTDLGKWVLQDPDFNTEYYHISDDTSPLSCEEIFTYPGAELSYKTNGFVIENKQNCINTVSDNFNCCYLYRYSYDGKKSLFFTNGKEDLDQKINDNDQWITFKEYIDSRGFNPKIFFISK